MNIIKICYAIEPRDRRYIKGYGFLSFAKNIGKTISNKYSQKLVDSAKKFATDAIKLLLKNQFKKQQKQLEIQLPKQMLIKLQVLQKNVQKNCL